MQALRVLVTGAAGFLGSRVVRQLLDRGHAVRAVVRTTARALPQEWRNRAEVVQADLQTSPALENLFDGVDVLIHLAATMRGTDDQHASTTLGTERILEAMRVAGSTRHAVLASSCSVYDWTAARVTLNEKSPLKSNTYNTDGYAAAKMAQEALMRRHADANQWTLSVLRPGFIYGPGASPAAGGGLALGQALLVFAPFARLRLTHVENCAAAFVDAAEKHLPGTFNIIDDDPVSAWRYAGRLNHHQRGHFRIPVPYFAGLAMVYLASMASRVLPPASRRKLPAILNPHEYRARFKPLQYDNRRAREELGWECQPLFETGQDVI